jgi:hypothetical protein
MDLTNITTEKSVATYLATNAIFIGLIKEIRELSKKKPDAVMSSGKVKIINRVLADLKSVLEIEPQGKFLDLLDDEELPQTSDAVLVMVQYETALGLFKSKYTQTYGKSYNRKFVWITPEFIKKYEGSEDDYDD